MQRSVLVRVFESDGRPARDARVNIWVYQFAAGGFAGEQYTNSSGEAEFDLDIDDGAEIEVYVNGESKTHRMSVQGSVRVQL
jgi:hypothetical protein